ncbi:DUF4097 family beta strand repeat-containing protein [Paenibacillus caui]|uniref:DUF4097 family beta strand repeat-containing protein n=1 Tax=Paenibacillus caui TaxID=2873927 RepID=UPI001CA7BC49|nr:DUF4097 family beta strand repeat-containing protein [Paenibacillus caui]
MKKVFSYMIATLVIGVLAASLSGCGLNSKNKVISFKGDQLEQINIHANGQNIKLRPSSDSQVKVSMKTNKELPATLEGGVLTIDLAPLSGFIHFKTATLYVDVPVKSYQKISLTSTSGSISVEDLTAKEMSATADSGDIAVKGLKGKVDAETGSGKITSSITDSSAISTKGAGQRLNASVGAAEADAPQLTLRSVSGNIRLE